MTERRTPMPILAAFALATIAPLAALAAPPTADHDRAVWERHMRKAIAEMREAARYPEWSEPIAVGAPDPLLQKRRPDRRDHEKADAKTPATTSVWCSTDYAEAGDRVVVHARVQALPEPGVPGLGATAAKRLWPTIHGQVVDASGASVGPMLAFLDDGSGADERAADGIHTAEWTMPTDRGLAPGTSESFRVTVGASLPDGEVHFADTTLSLSRPRGHLTGQFRDLVRDGNLVVQAEVGVAHAGRFHLVGTLATPAGEPIARSQATQAFDKPGTYWMDLPFYGLILHERGATGRLQLASVSLGSVDRMPGAPGRVLTDAHRTQPVDRTAIGKRAWHDDEALDLARRMEAALEQSR